MKQYPFADKKGMPKLNLNSSNIVSYSQDDLQQAFDLYETRLTQHHLRNLYGKGGPAYRKHGDTKPRNKERRI